MYPTLFQFGNFRIDTYSVMWFIALSAAIVWSINRLSLYSLDEDESRRIMAISFFFMLVGAMIFKHIRRIPSYIADPSLMPSLNSWGLSEAGAVLGAFISAFILCLFSKKISFLKLCDVAAPPAMLSIAIGRWGCFLNGCCVGLPSKSFTALHFPNDAAGVTRHPVQIYYSVMAFIIVLFVLWVEKKILSSQKKHYISVIAPLTIILYALMRFAAIPFREYRTFMNLVTKAPTYQALAVALPLCFVWLMCGLLNKNSEKII